MRIDKFLKLSRIIKRRPVAKQIADQGRVLINGKPAKSAGKVGVGDEVTIEFGNKTLTVRVLQLLQTTKKTDASAMYEVVNEEYQRDYQKESDELL
ncbi:RNA-binding S4 domain-containing protein [Fructilactobacillus cliffordii]|uniref:RQC P-site tRNA stabilizing factor n=1 Tax=Fructilactobacillus cliffordii TaxID=2940299 RepID=A0A9Q9E2G3_9LACO|nr:RNA-binding S4 domain-containing protein [Fructilactobacillus cliffordii]USS87035.1 RNA-binding S4 domain-containing protein [Fructilactobacillus cliffordii]USS88759.1 RNA-binding S4 domain-containing protein [Fructilactobacillus cliffordii]